LFEVTKNLKHKLVLALLYYAGLRLGEVWNEKIWVDSNIWKRKKIQWENNTANSEKCSKKSGNKKKV